MFWKFSNWSYFSKQEEEASVRAHLIQLESQGAEANIPSTYKIQINNTNFNVVNVYDI